MLLLYQPFPAFVCSCEGLQRTLQRFIILELVLGDTLVNQLSPWHLNLR